MKRIFSLSIALLFFSACMYGYGQTTPNEWTKHKAKKWFKKKEWLGGLQLQPHKSVNALEFARQYQLHKIYWDKAFAFLKEHDLQTLATGRHPIDGDNVYATVTETPTKNFDSTRWESHQKYIDLQYVIRGDEKIGVSPITKLSVTKTYDAARDVANYSGDGKFYTAVPGSFFLFFPSDGHRPSISTGGNKANKKIVIKILYAR